eukprot:gene2245-2826_t
MRDYLEKRARRFMRDCKGRAIGGDAAHADFIEIPTEDDVGQAAPTKNDVGQAARGFEGFIEMIVAFFAALFAFPLPPPPLPEQLVRQEHQCRWCQDAIPMLESIFER